MPLRVNGSTSGYTELSAPATAGNNTVTLPTGNGSAYQLVRNGATPGTLEFGGAIVSGTAVASTSGTAIDFTGIPSWVKRVTVMFNGVSTSGTSHLLVQLGTGGSAVTTGYLGSGADGPTLAVSLFTTGFGVKSGVATAITHGTVVINNVSGNTWVASGTLARSEIAVFITTAGSITLSGTLDRVRITTVNGSDAFDAGSINILYE